MQTLKDAGRVTDPPGKNTRGKSDRLLGGHADLKTTTRYYLEVDKQALRDGMRKAASAG